jgi:glyoxylase-like metal-dependent hydrolase (beta-lactamase superfamily II)
MKIMRTRSLIIVNALIVYLFSLLPPVVFAQGTAFIATTDFSGNWGELVHEDSYERSGGPPLGDYQGIPLNDAGRVKADSHDHSEWSLPEFQCRPHSAPYQWRALGTIRFWNEVDPVGRDLRAIHIEYLRSLDRIIYMDGREHPPANALHSWSGFSTGEYIGDTLVVTTTHIKGSYIRRNGASFTDKATMTEFIDRHGEILSITVILDDVWFEEPLVQTTNYRIAVHTALSYYPCTIAAESISTNVPHFLPGETEQLEDAAGWIPEIATRGGAESLYPDFRLKLIDPDAETAPLPLPERRYTNADYIPETPEGISILPVQGNIYMLSGAGANIAVSAGPEGLLLVDTGTAEMQDQTLETVLELGVAVSASPKPNNCYGLNCAGSSFRWVSPSLNSIISKPEPLKAIRYIINTSASANHVGGNATLAELSPESSIVAVTFPPLNIPPAANVVAHENVLNRMLDIIPEVSDVALPIEVFYGDRYNLSQFFNGEGVQLFHVPNAHSDGDSVVYFRYSDVIAVGELIRADAYPKINVDQGGSINGILDGINLVLDLMVAEFRSQGGTLVIPAEGRLMDTGDIGNYRNMVAIIRDRVQALIDQGMSLQQVRAARPTEDYDAWFGSDSGEWTTAMFVEAVYQSLSEG